jgi:hypothetical protein
MLEVFGFAHLVRPFVLFCFAVISASQITVKKSMSLSISKIEHL